MRIRSRNYPGGILLGFGSTAYLPKRNIVDGIPEGSIYAMIGLGITAVTIPPLAIYFTYKYFRDNFEIIRKAKNNEINIEPSENNNIDNNQSMRRHT
jgi:hypothetical protein